VKQKLSVALLLAVAASTAACRPQRIGTNVTFACAHPTPDTTGWRRVPGPFPGYTILAPPTLTASAAAEGGTFWRDSSLVVRSFRQPWGSAQFEQKDARHADYSSCWTRVGGVRTYVVVRRAGGGFQVTGWYRRPSALALEAGGLDGVLSGASRNQADQAVLLRMVESLRPAR
jgi:hypothetical protein